MEPQNQPSLCAKPYSVEHMVKFHMVKKALNNTRTFEIFHPSAWGQCLRKIAYQYYNQQEKFLERTFRDVDPRMERIFDNGHGIHARWQNYLDNAGILRGCWKCPNTDCGAVYGEGEQLGIFNPMRVTDGWKCKCGNDKKLQYEEITVKSSEEFNFEGHCDAVVDVRGSKYAQNNQNDIFVVDFKSMKDEMFTALDGAKSEHVIQVHIYMWILNLHSAVVVYENKNDQRVREEFVPRNEAIIDKIKSQAIWLKELLKHKKLPFKPNGFTKSQFPCFLCEFSDICYK